MMNELPPSWIRGENLEQLCPCLKHTFFFPISLARKTACSIYTIFPTACLCNAYIVTLQKDGLHFRFHSSNKLGLMMLYEAIPLKECILTSSSGTLYYKQCKSEQQLEKIISAMKERIE